MSDTICIIDDDDMFCADDVNAVETVAPWIILIVDDDVDMHTTTRFSLNGVKVRGRPLEFLDAYTGAKAVEMVEHNNSIDLMLLDAVMESEHAGIDCAKEIRNHLGRAIPTIVMRSGFAGWETEHNLGHLTYIDAFLLKASLTRELLIETLNIWLKD